MVLVKILSAHVDVKEAADVLPQPQEQTLRADAAEFRAQIQMSAVQVFRVLILAATALTAATNVAAAENAAVLAQVQRETTQAADAAGFRVLTLAAQVYRAQIQTHAVQVFKVQILAADVQVHREATLAVQEYRARIPAATAPTAVTKIAAAEDAAAGHKPNKAPGNPGLLNIKQIQKAIL